MLTLYNALLLPLRVVAGAWSLVGGRDPARRREWSERLAERLPSVPPDGIWLHGASVGEVRVVGELVGGLRGPAGDGPPVSVSAVTRTGRSLLPGPPTVEAAFFAPLDFRSATRRVVDAVRPALLGIVETELWPNLLGAARERGVPTLLLNGRLGPDKMRRYRRLAGLYSPLVAGLEAIGAQSQADAERFESLGVEARRIEVTGNIKYDFQPPPVNSTELRRTLGLPLERPVFVAGSTAEGEDAQVLDAFEAAGRAHDELLLILAPRHPERSDAVERSVLERGLRVRRISDDSADRAERIDVLLVDGVGRLSSLYAVAQVAFVGGSLVPGGGHNVLEPASVGVPVLFGPHTEHVAEPADALVGCGGAWRVRDAAELGERIVRLLGDTSAQRAAGARARAQVTENQGALGRTLELIRSRLDGGLAGRGTP